jgi:hypothetical protein
MSSTAPGDSPHSTPDCTKELLPRQTLQTYVYKVIKQKLLSVQNKDKQNSTHLIPISVV